MANLDTVVRYLDQKLKISSVPDYPGALNGLQLRNRSGKATRFGAAVDASLPVVRSAVEEGIHCLVVHHGMFWQGAQRIDGAVFEKIALAMEADMAIYSVHIPLDVHPTLGNNALLAKALKLSSPVPFFEWKGIQLGLRAPVSMQLRTLTDRLESAVGGPVHVCPGGPEKIHDVAVITGGAGSEVAAIAAQGIDTFITGEGPHWSYTAAEELGVNVLYAGHYATETFGVKALAVHLANRYKGKSSFIDHPTGM